MKSSAILTTSTVILSATHNVVGIPIAFGNMFSADSSVSSSMSTDSTSLSSASASSAPASFSMPSSSSDSASFSSSLDATGSASSVTPLASMNSSSASGSFISSSSTPSTPSAAATLSPSAGPSNSRTAPNATQVLQLALTLEHLENAFYSQALSNFSASDFDDAGMPSGAYGRFKQIAEHESTHVDVLTSVLGNDSVAACNYSFLYTDPWSFAALSSVIENVGNAAYLGSVDHLVNDAAALNTSVSILSTEARQASWINSAILMGDPWSGPYDTPLNADLAYTIASSFITDCLPVNPTLPFTAYPNLTITSIDGGSTFAPGDNVTLTYDNSTAGSSAQYLAFFSGLNTTYANISSEKGVSIPDSLQGLLFAVVTTSLNGTAVLDNSLIAGPAALSFAFGSNASNSALQDIVMDTDTVPVDTVPGPSRLTTVDATHVNSTQDFLQAESALPPSDNIPFRDPTDPMPPGDPSMPLPPNPTTPTTTFVANTGLNTTPVKCKYIGSQYTHQSAKVTRDSVLGCGEIVAINRFEDFYLREGSPNWTTEFRDEFMGKIQKNTREATMYPFIVRLLTKICLYACKDDKDCLAFYNTANTGCLSKSKFEGSDLRPDLIAKRTTREDAQKIANGERSESKVFWHETESAVEVKAKFESIPPSVQTGSYIHVLPRVIPSLAGMLYLAWDAQFFYIYWSDTSGIVRSHHYKFEEEKSWDVLYRYVCTVVNPLTDLPTRDPTMSINPNPISPEWTINCKEKTYNAVQLYGATAHSRQTCVLWDPVKKRVIKDHWCDDDRRYRESNILEKIKGVPGVSQVDFSEVVKRPGDLGELATSKLHSGRESTLKHFTIVFKVIRSVLKKRRVLHRDISRYNILINPEHFDTELDDKLDDGSDVKFINQVLDPSLDRVKEEGILIDWDNAAELDAGVGDALTERTGTPMFVSLGVGAGKIKGRKNGNHQRDPFPVLTGKAKDLYIKAYGQETYDRYINVVEESDLIKMVSKDDDKNPRYRHAAYHDVESFFWVLVYELLVAYPENGTPSMSASANILLLQFQGHDFIPDDFRKSVLDKGEESWKEILHPRLGCLAEFITILCGYFVPEWAFWPELPEDHTHEAFKRLLLAEIAKLDAANDPIALNSKERKVIQHPDAIRNSSFMDSHETPSPRKSGSKRSCSDMTGMQEEKSRKRSREATSRPMVDVFGSPSDVAGDNNERLPSLPEESIRKSPLGREGKMPST
ncbi:hypothetical protein EW145_g4222 [Phellinidium pouzarii]|uniref:Fungal-type protein kinase domain-containing protein n=1 Tax=Phellinidium pouzarii TaxID=167371 RepID=A0A4S4L4G6_9AGAM|nr:hypothetical protein EW145_g4222 [Phellinidium pouzarii]